MQRIILYEGLANFTVLVIKAIVGLTTGSFAILGDALHSLTDLANNLVAWFVVRLSERAPDREHPYGHRKFEVLAVFGLATLLVIFAVEFAQAALRREALNIDTSHWGLALMLTVLATNIALASWQRYWAKRLNSLILEADAQHTFADVLTTVAVIIGWQLSSRGMPWLDTACALAVAVYLLFLAFGLFKRAIPVLVDEASLEPELLIQRVASVEGVRHVNRVRSRWIGSHRAVDVVVTVQSDLSTVASHAIADLVENLLETDFDVQDVSVHVEPEAPGNSTVANV